MFQRVGLGLKVDLANVKMFLILKVGKLTIIKSRLGNRIRLGYKPIPFQTSLSRVMENFSDPGGNT